MARRADRLERREFFKVLLPRRPQNLRVPCEIARVLGDGDGAVFVVGALGRVWPVELRGVRAGGDEEAFLARGREEFARAHGVGVGWFVVFRLEGRGVLSIEAFDTTLCRREFCTPRADLTRKNMVARPQFIGILLPEFSRKMVRQNHTSPSNIFSCVFLTAWSGSMFLQPISPRFVRNHMPRDDAGQEAMIFSPFGEFWRIGLQHNRSYVFFGSGWAEFLMAHGISEGHLLLFRYEGNMVFTIKVYELSGCLKENYGTALAGDVAGEKTPGDRPQAEKQQPKGSSINRKRKRASESSDHAGRKKKPECSPSSVNKKKAHPKPVHLITKTITARALKHNFTISQPRCASVGLPTSCAVTLKTSAQSKRSWKATFRTANTYCYLQSGWKEFCRDNNVREGDQCTINIVETNLWHVIITSSKLS